MYIKTSINKTTTLLLPSFSLVALPSGSQGVELIEHTRGIVSLLVIRVRGAACCQLGRVSGQIRVEGLECLVQGLLLLCLGSEGKEGGMEGGREGERGGEHGESLYHIQEEK
jgi:hypothetical protein